jgi:Sulfotransferase family
MSRRPNLFIIGAPKSGTTSLYSYLSGHPDIFMSAIKEPNFFAPDVRGTFRASPFRYPDETDRYLALFDDAAERKIAGEASTSYLVSHEAPHLVHDFAPHAYIVAMLRQPVDLMYSLHNERVANGGEPITDFEEAMRADADRQAGRRLPSGFNALGAVYRETALLGQQLERWMQVFDRRHIHTIVFSDFAADTPGQYRAVLEFVGVDPSYRPAAFEVANRSWRRREGMVRLVVRGRPAQALRHTVMPRLMGEQGAFRMARGFTRSRFYRRTHQRPDLRPEFRQELEASFADDVRLLGSLIGRDLSREWLG